MVKKIKLGGKHCIMVDVNVTRHKCRVPLEADELVLLQFKEGPLLEIQVRKNKTNKASLTGSVQWDTNAK